MSSNENYIKTAYSDTSNEDSRFSFSRAKGLEAHYTKKIMSEYINKETCVLEVGCATGYYAMHFADKCNEYVGVDITRENIVLFNEKISKNNLKNVRALIGDGTRLDNIPDNSFDVVCCFGPMYHLPLEERKLVFAQCKRVCKDGGIVAFAYISPYGYLKGILMYPEYYPNQKTNQYVLKKGVDDIRPNVFFFATPKEMAEQAKEHGFSVIKNIGVDFSFDEKMINDMSEEKFAAFLEYCDYITNCESCAGLSDHALLICRK